MWRRGTQISLLIGACLPQCGGETITLGGEQPAAPIEAPAPLNQVCESRAVEADKKVAYLSLLFDVSGSMGQLDCPFWNHDPWLKWWPVSDAIVGFLERSQSAPTFASMTLFPAADDVCGADSYAIPDVTMTELPSNAFRTRILSYEEEVGLADYTDPMPYSGGNWRGGTPTREAVSGALEQLEPILEEAPESQPVILLMTDGVPGGCGEAEEALAGTVELVRAARERGILTYVIGVREPELVEDAQAPWEADGQRVWACLSGNENWIWDHDDPESPYTPATSLEGLHAIAEAGGTGEAIILDTGNPDSTENAFRQALEGVRLVAPACSIELESIGGKAPVPERLRLRFDDAQGSTEIPFDADCLSEGWRFSEESPPAVQLCPEACSRVGEDESTAVTVEYLCTTDEWEAVQADQ